MHDVKVPCNGCTACCRGRLLRPLEPKKGDVVAEYKHLLAGGKVPVLAWSESGDCIYLGPGGCTIYKRRPSLCRGYDCRVQYLSMTSRQRKTSVRVGLHQEEMFRAAKRRLSTLSPIERVAARKQKVSAQEFKKASMRYFLEPT